MINHTKSAARILACLLISISANTYAAGDIEAGKLKSQACQACHGPDGNSFTPIWPNLASQLQPYLMKQIHDFQSGQRKDDTMSPMVAGLTDADLLDITAYFAAQSVKTDSAEASASGKRLYMGGNSYSKLPACASCHGPSGTGNGPGLIPALAGQKAGYTAKTLNDFKSGARANDHNNIMREIAAKMSDSEIQAVSAYIAGIKLNTAAR